MRPSAKWLIGVGFAITIPLTIVGVYLLYFVIHHHMFIVGWKK